MSISSELSARPTNSGSPLSARARAAPVSRETAKGGRTEDAGRCRGGSSVRAILGQFTRNEGGSWSVSAAAALDGNIAHGEQHHKRPGHDDRAVGDVEDRPVRNLEEVDDM